MTWSILCNLFFLYNKKRHGRILFFHTYYLLLYSTRYTFFSIICVSCTYFPLRVNWIHSIHAYHLYLILHPGSEISDHSAMPAATAPAASFHLKVLSVSSFLPFADSEAGAARPFFPGCPCSSSLSAYPSNGFTK